MLRVITMTAYRRPAYTREVFAALAQCDGVGDWLLLPNVEPGHEEVIDAFRQWSASVRWRQFHGQSECLRLLGKVTFPGGSEYRCLFSVVPIGRGLHQR